MAVGLEPTALLFHVRGTRLFPKSRFLFPRLIVVPLSSQEVDGVRKEKERLTAGQERAADRDASDTSISYPSPVGSQNTKPIICY